ncbi:MAG: sulfatase-like hydrolase/transferase, partial [Myxococcota bacterium]
MFYPSQMAKGAALPFEFVFESTGRAFLMAKDAPPPAARRIRHRPLRAAALISALWLAACAEVQAPARPDVLMITLDTTRADHLGCYGYGRPTSPNLDALAGESLLFERAYSTSSWTLPAHASLFTGRFPASHGVRHDPDGSLILAEGIPLAPTELRARALGPNELTLAQVLKQNGYDTGAVVAGPWLLEIFGLGRGFDFYDD